MADSAASPERTPSPERAITVNPRMDRRKKQELVNEVTTLQDRLALLEQQLLEERQARNRTPTQSNEEDLHAGPSARYGNSRCAR
jgi:hypothetical protein